MQTLTLVGAAQVTCASYPAAVTQELSHSDDVRVCWGQLPRGGLAPRYSEMNTSEVQQKLLK